MVQLQCTTETLCFHMQRFQTIKSKAFELKMLNGELLNSLMKSLKRLLDIESETAKHYQFHVPNIFGLTDSELKD